jgi:polyisoprenoid-binding protein YceI
MNRIRKISLISSFVVAMLASPAYAQWKLDNDASHFNFISVKKTNVAEVHEFQKLSGEVSDKGDIRLVIDLSSVETQIPIRNERIKTMLFEIAQFPTAEFAGQIDAGKVGALKIGDYMDMMVTGKLALHGKTQDVTASLRVTRLQHDRVQVVTKSPIILNADQYDLAAGIDKLREIAGLSEISLAVPVSFTLIFKH